MSNDRTADIARRNGARSRGPVTAEGKARSSQNAVKHGLLARNIELIAGEDPRFFEALQEAYYSRYQPADEVERTLLDQMICSCWRLRRLVHYETEIIEEQIEDMREQIDGKYHELGEIPRGALAFRALADSSNVLTHFARYETTIRRTYMQALRNLRELQAERRNQPLPDAPPPQPECPNEPAAAENTDFPIDFAPSSSSPAPSSPSPATPDEAGDGEFLESFLK